MYCCESHCRAVLAQGWATLAASGLPGPLCTKQPPSTPIQTLYCSAIHCLALHLIADRCWLKAGPHWPPRGWEDHFVSSNPLSYQHVVTPYNTNVLLCISLLSGPGSRLGHAGRLGVGRTACGGHRGTQGSGSATWGDGRATHATAAENPWGCRVRGLVVELG